MKKKKVKAKAKITKQKIHEFYYMIPTQTNVKNLSSAIHAVSEEQIEIWSQLDLMEVVLTKDSLIFQNCMDIFEFEEDLAFLEEKGIKTAYQISYDDEDRIAAIAVLQDILNSAGGFLCSDTDDFQPIYEKDKLDQLTYAQ